LPRIIKSPEISKEVCPVPGRSEEPVEPRFPPVSAVDSQAESQKLFQETELQCFQMLEQARAEASQLVKDGQARAESLLQQARTRCLEIEEQARQTGMQAGREQGRLEIEETLSLLVQEQEQTLLSLAESIRAEKEKIISRIEPQLIDLACAIAGKIVRKEIAQDDLAILRIVEQAISLAVEKEKLRIRLNPADLEILRQYSQGLKQSHDGIQDLELQEDPRIERGGCVIETPTGNVDGRLERQLEEIRRALKEL